MKEISTKVWVVTVFFFMLIHFAILHYRTSIIQDDVKMIRINTDHLWSIGREHSKILTDLKDSYLPEKDVK